MRKPMVEAWWIGWLMVALSGTASGQQEETYAEKLGWEKGDRVVIIHVDDVGMSHDSNVGGIRAVEEGVANSLSVMMPCPWVSEFVHHLKKNPDLDAGLHLTLTSEWSQYRWGPLVGRQAAPGLVDEEGCLWRSVAQVVAHASADEVEAEIRAQLDRARTMGFEPTHLDSHMGTLFATPEFLGRYIKVGVETGIPIMFPGGHATLLERQLQQGEVERLRRAGRWQEGQEPPRIQRIVDARLQGKEVWKAGLPVLDDLHNTSYGWHLPEGVEVTDETLRRMKVEKYTEALRSLRPGVTMIILHATDAGPYFEHISSSGPTRRGDLLAMLDPSLKNVIAEEGLILTTWRELKERRLKVGRY